MCEISEEMGGSSTVAFDVVQGVIIGLIHHTDANTFNDIQKTVYDFVDKLTTDSNSEKLTIGARLLYVMFTVRKGNRINDWATGASLILDLLDSALIIEDDKAAWEIAKCSAVLLQTADMDVVIPKGAKIIERIQKHQVWVLTTNLDLN